MVFVGRKHLFLLDIVEGHLFYTCSPFRSILVQSDPKMLLQNRDNKTNRTFSILTLFSYDYASLEVASVRLSVCPALFSNDEYGRF